MLGSSMSSFFFEHFGRCAPSAPPSPWVEEEWGLLWKAGLLRENHPSKEPRARALL